MMSLEWPKKKSGKKIEKRKIKKEEKTQTFLEREEENKNCENQIKLPASGKPCRKSSSPSAKTRFDLLTGTAARQTGQLEWE